MKGKFYQTPDGNLTVLTLDEDSLLIWVDGVNYLVTNPGTQNPIHTHRIGELEFDNSMTPKEIKARIDDYVKNNKSQQIIAQIDPFNGERAKTIEDLQSENAKLLELIEFVRRYAQIEYAESASCRVIASEIQQVFPKP